MAYITTSDLEVALCKTTGSLAADPKALLAIAAAEQDVFRMTCLDFNRKGIATIPTPLIGANAACIVGITAGKWLSYTYSAGDKTIQLDPFTSLLQVISVPRGYDYTSADNCSKIKVFNLRDIVPNWRYSNQSSHQAGALECYYNGISFCQRDCLYCDSTCDSQGCTELWVKAEWAGETAIPSCGLPGALKMALIGYAAELYNMYCCGKASIKSESVEGYSITYKDQNDNLKAYMRMIKSFSACSSI
jgi:hypothetical protein